MPQYPALPPAIKLDYPSPYRIWLRNIHDICETPGIGRYVQYGGLIARLVQYAAGSKPKQDFLLGPCASDPPPARFMVSAMIGDLSIYFQSEIPQEISLDPGLKIILGHGTNNRSVDKWFWPPLSTFEESPLWNGEWSSQAEEWFLSRLQNITAAQFLTRNEWRDLLRSKKPAVRMACRTKKSISILIQPPSGESSFVRSLYTPGSLPCTHPF